MSVNIFENSWCLENARHLAKVDSSETFASHLIDIFCILVICCSFLKRNSLRPRFSWCTISTHKAFHNVWSRYTHLFHCDYARTMDGWQVLAACVQEQNNACIYSMYLLQNNACVTQCLLHLFTPCVTLWMNCCTVQEDKMRLLNAWTWSNSEGTQVCVLLQIELMLEILKIL